mgnify:CR=1 FL=1
MKNLIKILIILILFTSCNKNSEEAQNLDTVSGTYKLTNVHTNIAVDLNSDGVFNTNLTKESSCFNVTIIFKKEKSYISSSSMQSVSIYLPTNITCVPGNFSTTGTWDDNATNVFTIRTDGSSSTFIKESGNTLKFIFPVSTSPNPSQSISYFIYTKQ